MASRISANSFARKQLEKHGWKTGQGLGKSESGNVDPIKVKIKHDTAGVGHDLGEQFTYQWWDHVFNRAASNIVVESDKDGVRVKKKGDSATLISNKKQHKYSEINNKNFLYGNFIKSATLTEDGEHSENKTSSEDESVPEEEKDGNDRDEELFRACQGRTAHKGARHGLKLSGKLKRIQAQESYHESSGNSNKEVFEPGLSNETVSSRNNKIKRKRKPPKYVDFSDTGDSGIVPIASEGSVENGNMSYNSEHESQEGKSNVFKKGDRHKKSGMENTLDKNSNVKDINSGCSLGDGWTKRDVEKASYSAGDMGVEMRDGTGGCAEDELPDRTAKKKSRKSKCKPKSQNM